MINVAEWDEGFVKLETGHMTFSSGRDMVFIGLNDRRWVNREIAISIADTILRAVRDMDDARKEREGATAGTDATTPDV